MNRKSPNDEKIETLVTIIKRLVLRKRLKQNGKKEYFSNSQLNNLRTVYEIYGYQAAKQFQIGKVNPKDNYFIKNKEETLLAILEEIQENNLVTELASHIIANLNNIINYESK